MKRSLILSIAVFTFILSVSAIASAQLRLPRPSQKASVMQTVGITDVSITYYRPAVKGRKIWGEWPVEVKGEATLDDQNARPPGAPIVPYGHIWRTGANDATLFVVTDDVMINGQPLAAGSYSLHTIPGKEEWTVIFNTVSNQGGSFDYDAKKDALRVKTKPEWVTDNQEMLAFSIEPVSDSSAAVNLRWEKIRVPFTITLNSVAATLAKARPAVAAAKPDDWNTPFQAGRYAMQNKATDDGMKWLDQALKAVDMSIATKETFQNLIGRANILLAANRKDEGLAAADKAIERGKADKVDTAALEKRIADIRAGKN